MSVKVNFAVWVLSGALIGMVAYWSIGGFITLDWSINPAAWDKYARFWLVYCGFTGAWAGALWRAKP